MMSLRNINWWLGWLGLCLTIQIETGRASPPTPGTTKLWIETRRAFLRRCLQSTEAEEESSTGQEARWFKEGSHGYPPRDPHA